MGTFTKTMIYDSDQRGSPAIEELRDIFQFRDLIYQLVRRDVVTRYKRSILGIAWTLIQPLGMMIIISVVFSRLFSRVGGYPVYILNGLIAWTFFSQTTSATIHDMVWGGVLLKKIYLPSTAFAVSAMGTGLVNLSLSIIPLLIIAIFNHLPINSSILMLPVSMFLLAIFSLGLGLLISTFAIYFPDIAEMYQVILIAWMYLTPIIYPIDAVSPRLQALLMYNPMYYFVQMMRGPIYYGKLPSLHIVAISIVVATTSLVLGWTIFSYKSDEFAYRV